MRLNRQFTILILIFLTLLQFLLAASNINFLVNLDLLFAFVLVFLFGNYNYLGVAGLILTTVFLEVGNYQLIGLTALIFLAVYLVTSQLFRLVSFFNDDHVAWKTFIIFWVIIVSEFLIKNWLGIPVRQIDSLTVIANSLVFALNYLLYQRFKPRENAFKN